jgi:DNA-binding HxlR family transcriptional regulator
MEKDGLIERKVYAESPIRVEYNITEKGMALEPILEQMSAYSMKFCAKEVFKDGRPRKPEQVYVFDESRSSKKT